MASVPPEEQSKGGGFGGFGGFSSNSKSPVAIKGDTLDYDDQTGTAVWTGHVHAKQDTGEMTCDRLKVLFDKNTHQVNQMWSDGNVRISQGENYETGDHAHFDSGQHTVVLTGSPVAHNGENQITGDKMTVILDGPDKGKVKVEHARVVVFPHSTESKDNGAGTTPKL